MKGLSRHFIRRGSLCKPIDTDIVKWPMSSIRTWLIDQVKPVQASRVQHDAMHQFRVGRASAIAWYCQGEYMNTGKEYPEHMAKDD